MSGAAGEVRLVVTTAPSREVAEQIGATVVEERLAACATVSNGVTSIFRWDGAVQREHETLVLLKTTVAAAPALQERIAELHPYDVPEILTVGVEGGHEPYAAWVAESVEPR